MHTQREGGIKEKMQKKNGKNKVRMREVKVEEKWKEQRKTE